MINFHGCVEFGGKITSFLFQICFIIYISICNIFRVKNLCLFFNNRKQWPNLILQEYNVLYVQQKYEVNIEKIKNNRKQMLFLKSLELVIRHLE